MDAEVSKVDEVVVSISESFSAAGLDSSMRGVSRGENFICDSAIFCCPGEDSASALGSGGRVWGISWETLLCFTCGFKAAKLVVRAFVSVCSLVLSIW